MPPTPRVYGGIDGDRRTSERRRKLLAAGLDSLGSAEPSPTLTVRGVCKASGLVARYFYESFSDGDALVVAVYDEVIGEVIATTLDALAGADADAVELDRLRVGLGAILDLVGVDPRKGRVLFNAAVTHPTLARKRLETTRLFSELLAEQGQAFHGIEASSSLLAISRFLVGGLGELLTAWIHDDTDMTQDQLVELCSGIFQSSVRLVLSPEAP